MLFDNVQVSSGEGIRVGCHKAVYGGSVVAFQRVVPYDAEIRVSATSVSVSSGGEEYGPADASQQRILYLSPRFDGPTAYAPTVRVKWVDSGGGLIGYSEEFSVRNTGIPVGDGTYAGELVAVRNPGATTIYVYLGADVTEGGVLRLHFGRTPQFSESPSY